MQRRIISKFVNNEEEYYAKGYRYKLVNQCMFGNETNSIFKIEGDEAGYMKKRFVKKMIV